MKSPLKASIKNDYMGFNGTNIVSLGWNFAHRQVKIKTGLMVQRGDPTKTKQKQQINHL